jgi:hypothetical protein
MKGSTARKISTIDRMAEINGIQTGKVARIEDDGSVWVDYSGILTGPFRARLTGTIADRLRAVKETDYPPVILAFEANDPQRPIILDVLCETLKDAPISVDVNRDDVDDVRIDGYRVTFDASKEIVLRCGKSSITLTRAGKVLIRGAYLLNRSSGVNRIKGGAVQIN